MTAGGSSLGWRSNSRSLAALPTAGSRSRPVAADAVARDVPWLFQEEISASYDIDTEILGGLPDMGSTHKARRISTGEVLAAKVFFKSPRKEDDEVDKVSLWREQVLPIMSLLDHPNIIRLASVFEDQTHCYMMTEFAAGNDLFATLQRRPRLPEFEASHVVQHICRGLAHMHERQICHRDVKPENLVFTSQAPVLENTLKILDFEVARKFEFGETLMSKVGTPYYVAPQVLAGRYDHMCDLWSVGVILYLTLCGYPPFHGETDAEVLAKVRCGTYTFEEKDWWDISQECKHLIRMLLDMSPRARCTADLALDHDWVAGI
jgi:calcium-dependent protein kinase